MTTGLFVSDERKQLVDFTRPIWVLQDGLLVAKGNPRGIRGYRSVAGDQAALIGVISDQVQHQTALHNGVPPERIRMFATQAERRRPSLPAWCMPMQRCDGASRLSEPATRYAAWRVEVPQRKTASSGAFAHAPRAMRPCARRIDACLDELLGSAGIGR